MYQWFKHERMCIWDYIIYLLASLCYVIGQKATREGTWITWWFKFVMVLGAFVYDEEVNCSLHAIVKGEMKEKSKKPPSTTTLFCVKKFTWIWHPKQRMKGQYLSSSISQNILTTFSGTPLVPFVPFLLKLKQNMASCLSTLTSPSSVSFFLLDSGSIYSTYIPILFINH